ncbi:D-ribose pyranase [Facklamia miroungae]|uniref:D-ribose pyranase n=1 Tax=Facklamia miroungae TaxID=120956 RepID=A0A1G7QC28_9LACT|nr:D-ribose pyranase [Facklamia miroungae]NKZ28893.1 D-ribose pyranase [Facklamia miroungae]SDF95995.1 D-ribose pyranase [Facklamia miroungae]
MKKHGILNSHISKVLSDMGHTDQLTIADCGLPITKNIEKIDLAIRIGEPDFISVLKAVINDMKVERIILAEEIKQHNPNLLEKIQSLFDSSIEIVFIDHEAFKSQTQITKAVIRTGEATPYANVILQSGVIF